MIQIAKATHQDVEDLEILFYQLSQEHTALDALKRKLEQISNNESYCLLVARDNLERSVGTAMGIVIQDLVGACQPFMIIENVVVLDSCRKQGIGKMLVSGLESFARKNGCQFITIVSGNKFTHAHNFYQSIGYTMGKGFIKRL